MQFDEPSVLTAPFEKCSLRTSYRLDPLRGWNLLEAGVQSGQLCKHEDPRLSPRTHVKSLGVGLGDGPAGEGACPQV